MSNISTIIPAISLSASERVGDKIASWKASLLDLTVRNPLIALPTEGVVDLPSPNDVFEPLLRRRKPLTFWDIQNKAVDRTILREPGNYSARSAAWNTFRHLHLQTLSLLQGQDVNALYVVFGVLSWIDPATGEKTRSPLLLVPASLERRPDGLAYIISRSQEEDVEANPVLMHRFGLPDVDVALPPAPEESYLIPSAYLRKVASLIEDRPGWEVEEQTCLGLFPLLKMRLYEDLVAQEARAKGHPLVSALAGDPSALLRLPSVALPPLAEMSETASLMEQHLLLDADPAQQRAIAAAAQGQSFVLQGPPGTGKTQTITNIISECIAANKSVLLVSSRMASLDAVLRRLSDKGLGDLCLAAHSLKTSKSDILAQLEQGMSFVPARISSRVSRKDLEVLDGLRGDLNAFVRELHQARLPLGISVYQANALITENEATLQAAGVSPLTIPISDASSISTGQREAMEELVLRMAAHPALTDTAGNSIWNSAFLNPERPDLSLKTLELLESGLASLARIEQSTAALANDAGLDTPNTLNEAETLLRVFAAAQSISHLEKAWLSQDTAALHENRDRILLLQKRIDAFKAKQDSFEATCDLSLLNADHKDLQERLTVRHEAVLQPFLGKQWRSEALHCFEPLSVTLEEMEKGARDLYSAFSVLADLCGVGLDESSEGKQRLHRVALRASEVRSPATCWFAPGTIPGLIKQMDEVRGQWFAHDKLRDDLFAVYSEQVLDLDHPALLEMLRNQPSGLSRLLSTSSLRVANTVKSVTLSGANTKERDTLRDMESALQLKEMRSLLQNKEANLAATFGAYYQGATTDWDRLRAALQKADLLCAEFAGEGGRVPSSLAATLVLGGEGTEAIRSQQIVIAALLTGMHSQWEELTRLAIPASLPEPQSLLLDIAAWCRNLSDALTDYHLAYCILREKQINVEPEQALVSIETLVALLVEARKLNGERSEAEATAEILRQICGDTLFQGLNTDWSQVLQGLVAAEELRAVLGQGAVVPDRLADLLTRNEARVALCAAFAAAKPEALAAKDTFESLLNAVSDLFTPRYLKETLGEAVLEEARFDRLTEWIKTRLDRVDQIEEGARTQSLQDDCAASGFDGLLPVLREAIASGRKEVQAPETLRTLFRVQFYSQWVTAVAAQSPALTHFVGEEQERNILRFRDLDRKYLDSAPGRIREMTKARAPKLYPDEVKALKGQLARRRTGEVRKLLAEIPNLLFALKPCVMMNPLSVRLFLDAGAVPFDVVLFDDASQIATEDAIGAILRGSQVIIAGDPKQLPPVSLVQATAAIRDSASAADSKPLPEASGTAAFESVLDAACQIADETSTRFGNYSLNWHYRSQNESLIAFSRRYFYPGLVSFPSAQVSGGAISYLSVTDSKDEVESESTERVLQVVLDYKRRHPARSVGVITLTEADYARLLDSLARRKEQDGESVAPLLSDESANSEEGAEVFFIKMIENVQGDERDLIVLHVGGDPAQFTPLWQPGSDRLLNVATTRARCDMVVVSALTPLSAAAAAAENTAAGIEMLGDFLRYAQDPDALLLSERNVSLPQDSFIQSVRAALATKGYELRDQIGLSDYRVDLAIVDPAHPDRYLLGIECDGPVYAATETARHRDRLCTEMLNQRGWNLHRVWSLDWARDPNKQLKRIAAAVKAAKAA